MSLPWQRKRQHLWRGRWYPSDVGQPLVDRLALLCCPCCDWRGLRAHAFRKPAMVVLTPLSPMGHNGRTVYREFAVCPSCDCWRELERRKEAA